MTPILLSIILVSGYLFSINALPTRYKFKRSEGWSAYFFVSAWGILFFSIGWLLCSLLNCVGFADKLGLFLGFNKDTASHVIPFSADSGSVILNLQIATWAAVSMLLAFFCGLIIKLWYNKATRKHKAIAKAARSNPIEELMIEASLTMFPIVATLKSKKVYVGWVRKPALEHGKVEYISLIPLLSGYREKDTLSVVFSTNYNDHYSESGVYNGTSKLGLEHFRVVIPISELDNISLFDFDTYKKFNGK